MARDTAGLANVSTTSVYTLVVTVDDDAIGDIFAFAEGKGGASPH